MRHAFLIFFLSISFFTAAQKVKSPAYVYTAVSSKYFTDGEMDTLFYTNSQTIFKENGIPASLFEKKYPDIKNMLIAFSKNAIVSSFSNIEAKRKKNTIATKGTTVYDSTRKLYSDAFAAQIRKTFYKNKGLSAYLSFNTSDRITYFNSTVRINPNGKLTVTEKITVYNGNGLPNPLYGNDAELEQAGGDNNEIKRGIVRTFPLSYINKYKLFQNTTFELKQVLCNGKKTDYHTEKKAKGILLYTGSSSIYLDPGYYTYTITYETDHQLKLLNNFDELYWNVTGNGWSFRIDSAKCTVILPKGAIPLSSKCYTGSQGETSENCNFTTTTAGDSTILVFKSLQPLSPYNGITIATSWPKEFITTKMSGWANTKYYIWNNPGVFFLPIAALFSGIFCFVFWYRHGRDPKRGSVYPQFEPPVGYSPAALGYIYHQKFSRQLTAATIIDAAVRNIISIDVEREGLIFKHNEYNIRRSDKTAKPTLSKYEDFRSDVIDLTGTTIKKGKYNSSLGDLNGKVMKHCQEKYKITRKKKTGLFKENGSYTALPILVCLVAAVWAFFGGVVKAMYLSNFWQIGYFVAGIILCVVVLKIFARLLAAYSPEGRKLMDNIEGFRMFLATADEQRFDTMAPPKKSLELYEKYLPFAIALSCEIEWGEKFEEIISTAVIGGAVASSFSHSMTRDSSSFGSSFSSSFSGAITSASTPPSSSSGGGSSFGGGSSGGGGGGGGGGGW